VTREVVSILTKGGKGAIDHLGFNMPKGWDIDNRLVDQMIIIRRHPQAGNATASGKTNPPGKTTASGKAAAPGKTAVPSVQIKTPEKR
jgi:hypothetical protein